MNLLRSWKNASLLLLAHVALSGCVTPRSPAPIRAPDAATEADLRARAELLCRHGLETVPAPSRFPEGFSPADAVRAEDLAFVTQHPEKLLRTPLDRPGFHEELARYVRCEATDVRDSGFIVNVSLKRTAPRFPEAELAAAANREEARALLEKWMQQAPEQVTRETYASFIQTPQGWRATYWLPEKAPYPVDKTNWPPEGSVPTERMTAPRRIEGPQPQYTAKALSERVEGAWVALCILTREGYVTRCRVLKSLPYMDEALLYAFQNSRYTPATYAGKPVEIDYIFHVRLQLPRQ